MRVTRRPEAPGKIPPKTKMVTRNKSTQLKRNLRERDHNMKRITQLLLSPKRVTATPATKSRKVKSSKKTTKNNSSKKISNNNNNNSPIKDKSPKKQIIRVRMISEADVEEEEHYEKEYYPNNLKRTVKPEKVYLKPQNKLKLIGSVNKRKLLRPIKGLKSSSEDSTDTADAQNSCRDVSLEEMVRINDESMTDEDMLEILTCPSPVWWEEPPNEEYIDDPLFSYDAYSSDHLEDEKYLKNIKFVNSNKNLAKVEDKVSLQKRDDIFIKKQTKLENILGIIKNKVTCVGRFSNENSTNEFKEETRDNIFNEVYSKKDNMPENRTVDSESDVPSIFSFQDVKFLKCLESMEIPIERNILNVKKKLSLNKEHLDEENLNKEKIQNSDESHKTTNIVDANDYISRKESTPDVIFKKKMHVEANESIDLEEHIEQNVIEVKETVEEESNKMYAQRTIRRRTNTAKRKNNSVVAGDSINNSKIVTNPKTATASNENYSVPNTINVNENKCKTLKRVIVKIPSADKSGRDSLIKKIVKGADKKRPLSMFDIIEFTAESKKCLSLRSKGVLS